MKNLILTLIITLPLTLWGQVWENTYLFGLPNHIIETNDDNFLISFRSDGFQNLKTNLLKIDINGDTIWSKEIENGPVYQSYWGFSSLTSDSNILVTQYPPFQALTKLNQSGDVLWTYFLDTTIIYPGNFNDEYFSFRCGETYDNGYFFAGPGGQTGDSSGVFILRLDSSRNYLWHKNIGFEKILSDIITTNDNGFVVTGGDFNDDFGYVIKLDQNGDIQWQIDSLSIDGPLSNSMKIIEDFNGNYILSNPKYNGLNIYKISGGGTIINNNFYNTCRPLDIKLTNDGGFILCGNYEDPINFDDGYCILKIDSNFNIEWEIFGLTQSAISITQTYSDDFIVVGGFYFDTDSDGIEDTHYNTMRINNNGSISNVFNLQQDNQNRKLEKTIDILGKETKPQPNTPIIEIYDDGTVEKKVIVD